LALPQSVVGYLDRLRGLGMQERYIELERDAWIMIAAQVPHLVDDVIARKHEALEHPDMSSIGWSRGTRPADRRDAVYEIADVLERLMIAAVKAGETGSGYLDDQLVNLMDMSVIESAPGAERLMEILAERGWKGWTRIERVLADRLNTQPGSVGQPS
jgi:hypothetical protein